MTTERSDVRVEAQKDTLGIVIPNDLIERISQRTAEIILLKLPSHLDQPARWLDLRTAAEHCSIPYGTMQKLASAHQIPGAVKQGKRWICDRHTLDAWLQNGATPHRPPKLG